MRRPGSLLVFAALLAVPAELAAEWQFKPFLGVSFAPQTTYVDFEQAAGSASEVDPDVDSTSSHMVIGGSVMLLGEVLGVEADFGRAGGFFEAGDRDEIQQSRVQTLSGNVVVALPRRLSQYTLRPFFVAGLGVMSVRIQDRLGVLDVADRHAAVDVGGGVTGFLNEQVGLGWDLRHFRSLRAQPGVALFEDGQLSFWRANMSVVLRY